MTMTSLRIEYVAGLPCPIVESPDPVESSILSAYLREALSFSDDMMKMLDESAHALSHPVSGSWNEIFFDVYDSHVTISSQWLKDELGDDLSFDIPITRAKTLLIQWRELLASEPPRPL